MISDSSDGPHTVEPWSSGFRGAFQRLNPATEAGNFGNSGRNIARAAGIVNVDLSLLKILAFKESRRLQFRVECFNLANHANFGLPVTDLASLGFGRILEAAPPRLVQFGLKF